MKLVRYQTKNQPPRYGWVYDQKIGPIEGSITGEYRRMEADTPLEQAVLLPPVQPSKIICIGRNYIEHAREQGVQPPEIPMIFLKPPSSLIGHEASIELPSQSNQVEQEAELAVVIGRRGKNIPSENAMRYILGYTIANDVTARDLQRKDGTWTRGKGFDTFCPLGPWVETDLDPVDVQITCRINQEIRQLTSTRQMIFSIPQIIAFISSVMTLEPEDVILTGTPAGVGPLSAGDVVEISIEGIGLLRNPVILAR
ncbi:MAG TPA: fumarylacetoacetate hydrolase family protein [Anaerolineaceae bacterium]